MKSALSFFRRAIGVKGYSVHTGRGAYECGMSLPYTDVFASVKSKLPKWQAKGYIESFTETECGFEIVFSQVLAPNDYYRKFVFFNWCTDFECKFIHTPVIN